MSLNANQCFVGKNGLLISNSDNNLFGALRINRYNNLFEYYNGINWSHLNSDINFNSNIIYGSNSNTNYSNNVILGNNNISNIHNINLGNNNNSYGIDNILLGNNLDYCKNNNILINTSRPELDKKLNISDSVCIHNSNYASNSINIGKNNIIAKNSI